MKTTEVKEAVEAKETEVKNNEVQEQVEQVRTFRQIIDDLIKNGNNLVKDLTIRNVTVTEKEEYTRLGISLDKSVEGYVNDNNNNYELGKTNIIFVSSYSIAALLKDNEDAAFAVNHLVKHPDAMAMILSRAKVNIIQEYVTAGDPYRNPFSNTANEVTFDHDVIINHIVSIHLSEFGLKRLDKLADMMLGF